MTTTRVVRVDAFTIYAATREPGSDMISHRVDKNDRPFGMLWTFKATATETHRWHAKALSGAYANFADYAEAESFLRGC